MRRAEGLNKVWVLFKAAREMNLFSNYSFHHFFTWGLKIADIIDELELEEVDEKKLKNLPFGTLPEEIRNIISCLGEVKKNFYTELKNNKLTTRGMDYAAVASNLDSGIIPDFSFIYTGGFFAPTRLEEKILKYLNAMDKNIHFVQDKWDKWNFENIHLHSGFDVHSEIKRAGEILEKGFNPAKTAIVLPQADVLIPLLSMVVSGLNQEYNISMGYPLERASPFTLLEQIMHFQEARVGDEYYAKDYLSILLHPYVKNLSLGTSSEDTRTLIHKIEEKLSDRVGRAFIHLEEVEKEFVQIKEVHINLIRNLKDVRTFSQLGKCFEDIFSFLLARSPAQFYPFSGEFFKNFFAIFRDMQDSMLGNEEMEKEDIFDLFRYYVNTVRVPFSGIPLSGLQILGMLETRNLFFEKVIVLDVQEGVIPNEDKYDPILPTSVRRFLELPTYRQREKIFRHHFMNLVNTAAEVHLIYREYGKESRSRFIEEIIWEKEQAAGEVAPKDIVTPVNFRVESITRKPFSIKKDEKTMEILNQMILSPTSIDAYLNCPAQFYFSSVLKLEEKESVEREPDLGKIGSFIHEILYKFYEPLKGSDIILTEKDRERLEQIIDTVLKEKFGELRGENYLLNKITKFRLSNFFENEKKIEGYRIIGTEENFNGIAINNIPGINHSISLKGRIDRIDQREKKIYIIDYKTGDSKKPIKKLSIPFTDRRDMKSKIRSFQLPVYVYLYREKNPELSWNDINAGFSIIRNGKEEFLFSEKDDNSLRMEEIFLPSLKNLIGEIFNPAVNFEKDDEDEHSCQFCPYFTFCL